MSIATKIPTDVFEHIAINAGVILTDFDTESWTVDLSKIIGATSGGVNFTDEPEYIDYGEDIDNCPKNMKELKRINSREVKLSGEFVSVSADTICTLAAAADLDTNTITPRDELKDEDFKEIWYVVDYGKGGAIAIHMKNCLNTSGVNMQTGDREKATNGFEFTAHYSMDAQDEVPYEIIIKESDDSDDAEEGTQENT